MNATSDPLDLWCIVADEELPNLMDEIIPNLWLGENPSSNQLRLNANGIHSILTIMKDQLTTAPDVSGPFYCP
jgi:hypothetical protein